MKNSKILFSEGIAIVKNFNDVDIEALLRLKDFNMPVRVLFYDIPSKDKIDVFNDMILTSNASRFTLVLSSKNTHWINLNDFQCFNQIQNVEIHNTTLSFNSIDGIQNFKTLKSFSLFYRYGKEIELELLKSCNALEELVLDEPLTKQQHEILSQINSIKKIKIKSLNPLFLTQKLANIEFLEVHNLLESSLGLKMPYLKKLRIYNSNKITELDFLSSLQKLEWLFLCGLNKVTVLPDFTNLSVLQQVALQNMKRLNDVSSLKTIKQLTTLCLRYSMTDLGMLSWLTPESFPFLKNLNIELKSKGETKIFYERFENVTLGSEFILI